LSFRELLADMADLNYEKISRLAAMGISPADLQQATGIRANTMPRTWAELFKQMKDGLLDMEQWKAIQLIEAFKDYPQFDLTKRVKIAPIPIIPNSEKEYLEKLNKKRIIF